MKTEITISAEDVATAMGVLAVYIGEANVPEELRDSVQRVHTALGEADRIVIAPAEPIIVDITRTPTVFDGTVFANTVPTAITPTQSTPTSDSTQRAARTESTTPQMRVCVIRVDEGFGPGGSEEVWFAPRSGLYRVLDLLGDPVDASLDKFSIEALEQYCDIVASRADTSGAVQWTFAPVLDAHVS